MVKRYIAFPIAYDYLQSILVKVATAMHICMHACMQASRWPAKCKNEFDAGDMQSYR